MKTQKYIVNFPKIERCRNCFACDKFQKWCRVLDKEVKLNIKRLDCPFVIEG